MYKFATGKSLYICFYRIFIVYRAYSLPYYCNLSTYNNKTETKHRCSKFF